MYQRCVSVQTVRFNKTLTYIEHLGYPVLHFDLDINFDFDLDINFDFEGFELKFAFTENNFNRKKHQQKFCQKHH